MVANCGKLNVEERRGLCMYPQWILDNKDIYKMLLEEHNEYSDFPVVWVDDFEYETITESSRLNVLNRKYGVSRIKANIDLMVCFKAMDWTFNQLIGQVLKDYVGQLCAIDIIDFVKKNRCTVNCLCHATVLTEVLLALGFRARKISCLPIDIVPFDNHVVVTVFVPSLSKWVMLDPSMSCYIVDDKESVLSIREIREHLITKKPIEIRHYSRFKDVSIPSESALKFDEEEYKVYLYKNFFRFLSRRNQNSNPTSANDIFYMLIPDGYLLPNIECRLFVEDADVTVRLTNNQSYFWQEREKR